MSTTISCRSLSTEFQMESCALYDVESQRFVTPYNIMPGKIVYKLRPFHNYLLFNLTKPIHGEYYFEMIRLYLFPNGNLIDQHYCMIMFPSSVYKVILQDPTAPAILKEFLSIKPEGQNPALPNLIKKFKCEPKNWRELVDEIRDYLNEVV